MQFKHNQFIADFPEILEENPKQFWYYCRSKKIHRTNCHKGLSATNPNDMDCVFNKYFALAFNNNTGEAIAFVVAEMTSSVAKISFFVTDITFKVHVISG